MRRKKRNIFYVACIVVMVVSSMIACSILGQVGAGPVDLGTAGDFVILAKSEISTVPMSTITGDVGLSPAATSYLHGFSQTDATGYATSTQVFGKLYVADMADPTPMNLTTAVADMEAAYTDAATRITPDHLDLGGGTIDGLTLAPGLYTWGSSVVLNTAVTLQGGLLETWVFQVANNLTVGAGAEVVLSGGALPQNIVWQVAGTASLGANSDFKGTILCKTDITMESGATLEGRALAQTLVSMVQSVVTEP